MNSVYLYFNLNIGMCQASLFWHTKVCIIFVRSGVASTHIWISNGHSEKGFIAMVTLSGQVIIAHFVTVNFHTKP